MTLKFSSLSSGSKGNCQYIETENIKILIDSGFSGKKIEELLKSIKVSPDSLDAILITHEHSDHMKGAGVLSRRYDIPIYANNGSWEGMYNNKLGKIKTKNEKIITSDIGFFLKDLYIEPVPIYHDANEPLAYIVNYKNKKLSILTDTGIIDKNIENKIKDSDLYLMESNHDVDMLLNGLYPYYLKMRIRSELGHLSNEDAGNVLKKVIRGKGEKILLGHLSESNNVPELAHSTVEEILGKEGLEKGQVDLGLTYTNKATKIYEIG